MNMISTTDIIVALVVVAAAIVIGSWVVHIHRQRQSLRLQRRFGPEYERAIQQYGGRKPGEAELLKRETRVSRMHLVPLAPIEAARFTDAWRGLQGRFIDDP